MECSKQLAMLATYYMPLDRAYFHPLATGMTVAPSLPPLQLI